MKKLLLLICLSTLLSCEKNITIKTGITEQLLVVEAEIENNEYPVVVLSKSLDYFGKINPQLLANSFVHNATIDINNGTRTHRLKEYTVPVNAQYSISFYTVDFANLATAFKGAFNKQYNLSIAAEGKNYYAITSIPNPTRRVDSLWWENVPNTTGSDTVWKKLMVKAFDPAGLGDNIRYYTKRNSEAFLPGDPSVFDDAFIDGTQYEIQIVRGKDRNNPPNDGEFNSFFKRGDTVTLKTCNIDKATYDFWRTIEFNYQSAGNPFASPVKVASNITGNPALGYFGGYASQFRTIIIPR
jgi:hypothetical protein